MRLKQIKLVGFKSFVDTTKILFQQQMTAIVGPNGCGKSNVIDAVRWVLGESSAKNLRGDAMTDVIFNGATTRKPIGQASVELLFENTQGRLQGSMADRSEVAIKRLVTRDGSNSYFLNGSKCRRRDITDIFLGTGLGPRSYAIIEQGTISRLIESKPQELRVFIEEAAGISKYKEKRRDTENRIRHTRENLERLTDVIAELTTQIDKLHQQAEAAKRYKTLKTSERKYKAELSAFRWQQFEQKAQQFSAKQQAQQVVIAELQSKQRQDELAIINAKQLLDTANDCLAQLQQQKLNLSNDITRIEQTIKHQQQQTHADKKQADEFTVNQQKNDLTIAEQQQKLTTIDNIIVELAPQLNSAEQQLIDNQQDLTQQQKVLQLYREQWDKLNKQVQQQQQTSAKLSAQMATKQSLINQYHEQILQLNSDRHKPSAEQTNNLVELKEQISSQQQQLAQFNVQLENKQGELEKAQQQLLLQQQQQLIIKTKRQSLNDAMSSLKQSSPSTEHWQKQQAKWLTSHHSHIYGNLYQQLTVTSQWQLAAEVVLSSWLTTQLIADLPDFSLLEQQIILPDTIALSLNSPSLKIPTSIKITKNKKGTLAEQVNLVLTHTESIVNGNSVQKKSNFIQWLKVSYLNKIFLADDVIQAQQLLSSLAEDESVLCLDGSWLGHYFLLKGSPEQSDPQLIKHANSVKQKQQVEKLTVELTLTDKQLKISQQQKDLLTAQQSELIKQVKQLTALLQRNEQQWALMTQSQQHQKQQLNQTQQLINQHQQKITILKEQLNALEQTHVEMMQVDNAQKEQTYQQNDSDALIVLGEQKSVLQQHIQQREKQDKQLTQQSHQLSLQLTKKQAERDNIEQHLSLLLEKQQQFSQKLAQLSLKKNQQSQPLVEQQQQSQTWLQQMSVLEQKIIKQQQELLENQTIIDQYAKDKNTVLTKIERLKEQVNQYHLEAENNRLRAQSMLEQLNDMGQVLTDVLVNMPDNVREGQWQANITRLAKDIALLGPINLAAIDEYNQELTRKNFLDQQYQDLTLAINTLENAIAKIDKQSRQKFKVTFDKINNDLKRLFPRVFGGGSAYLALTGDDLLEAGVTIMARPPGKKNNTIHLLSGGEKALTALSLVFAIFRLNPAPFCMLDEVDAPLDDANVLRFCNLVKEMSKTVQFIYISHNKIAMEMAAHLTGVTMFEAGVSRMVSVDIDQAVAMAEMS